MSLRIVSFFFAFVGLASALTYQTGLSRILDPDMLLTKREGNMKIIKDSIDLVRKKKCNLNICFAVDGSGHMNGKDFRMQLELISLLAGIVSLDPASRYAAIQYGRRSAFISKLTGDTESFLLKVKATLQQCSATTFVARGISRCARQLGKARHGAKKIVILSDGRSNFRSRYPPRDPFSISQTFLSDPSNSICAVGVNYRDTSMLEQITGDPSRVFMVSDWERVLDALNSLVAQVCGDDAVAL